VHLRPPGDLFGQRRHLVAEYQLLDGWQAGQGLGV